MRYWKITITTLFTLGSLLMPLSVTAQSTSASTSGLEVQGLSIDPFLIEIDAAPGDVITRTITLTNTTNEPLNFIASLNDFVPNGTTGQPLFLGANQDADPKFSLSRWISITKQPQFTIPPLGNTEVEFTISIPVDVEPGTHYGGILFGRPSGALDATGSAVQVKAGSIILVKLGRSEERIQIEQFVANKKVYWSGTVNFKTILSNLGNVHAKPKGEITLKNIVGGQSIQLPVNRDANIVLPDSKREFAAQWLPKFVFGRYVAEEVIYYGNPKLELRATTVIWVVPLKQLAIVIVAVVVLFIILRSVVRRYNRMIIRRARGE
jgi:uncharacterized repeat protein (TIGR01451 family)